MTARVNIALAGRDYEVAIGSGLVDDAVSWISPLLRRPTVAIVMDQTIADLHGPRLIGALEAGGVSSHSIILPPGEATKSFSYLAELCDRLLALELDRGDMIIAFGGGVIGDLTGFAAAIYKRGIDFIQIPTTLLAQVDSSVGGKTAIDTPRGKNLIGAFHQPRLVLADLSMLDTLSARELRCGYGEVLKYGLLGDRGFFHWLEDHGAAVLDREPEALARAVRRSVEMKADIVAADEREGGARALLNLGHTFAHAIETLTGFGETLKHGEAVGLGCAMAFRFSAQLGFCQSQEADRVARAVAVAGLPSRLADVTAKPFCADSLMAAMAHDKKTKAGRLTFILARAIGEAFIADDVEGAAVRSFLLTEGATP